MQALSILKLISKERRMQTLNNWGNFVFLTTKAEI